MDIKILADQKEYTFTLRTNAKECRLDLTGYSDCQTNWSAFSEQCKKPEQRKRIEVPASVEEAAKAKLQSLVFVSSEI